MNAAHETFNALVAELDYPMYIVTAAAAGERAGCLVGFTTQTSIDPPRFLACVSRQNRTHRLARQTEHLAVHLVPAQAGGLAELFGGQTGDEVDKFSLCAWHPGPHGLPILEECPNWFVGAVLARIDAGDHEGFLLDPVAGEAGQPAREFSFHRARRIQAGHPA